jgi:uridine kinase
MNDKIQIFCENTGKYMDVKGGETLLDVYNRIKDEISVKPICAHVNHKTEGLNYPLFMPKMVNFIDEGNPSGQRMYVRSLCMVLAKAVHDLYPAASLCIEHSIASGYYATIDRQTADAAIVAAVKRRMEEIIAADIPFVRSTKLTTDVIKLFRNAGMADKVTLLETAADLYTTYYSLEGFVDSYYGDLVPSTSYVGVFDLVPYESGLLLLPPDFAGDRTKPARINPQPKLFKAFTDYIKLNKTVGVGSVGMLNKAVADKSNVGMLIAVAETIHDKKIGAIADQITERFRQGGARVVLVAGPSSSGKTTTTKRLSIHLLANLVRPQMISLDNYFVDREHTPRDENGDYDYESLYALDIEQFNKDLTDLIAGKEVAMPSYDFTTGKRTYKGNKLRLDDNSILLMEGIHGLNPELTASIPDEMKYKVYVSALTTLSIDNHNWVPTTDNRLLRRIVRDFKYRGTSALDTIRRWPSVRRGEGKWIFPYQENADAMFNSSLIFELGVMKDFAEPILKQVPHNVPEYAEAYRLLSFLSYFNAIPNRQIPATSLLREFLGGSSFKY